MEAVDAKDLPHPAERADRYRARCLGCRRRTFRSSCRYRVAATDPFKVIDDYTGSGPYVFVRRTNTSLAEVDLSQEHQVQRRKRAAIRTAGGKRCSLTASNGSRSGRANAAQRTAAGEIDTIEQPAFESKIPQLRKDNRVSIVMTRQRELSVMRDAL